MVIIIHLIGQSFDRSLICNKFVKISHHVLRIQSVFIDELIDSSSVSRIQWETLHVILDFFAFQTSEKKMSKNSHSDVYFSSVR